MANLDINLAEIERIYPTENDICFSPYNGVNGSEVNYSKNLHWRRPKNAILANLDGSGNPTALAGFVCSNGGGAVVNITRGRAYIEGRYVELNTGASFAVTVDTDKDTYIYLQLNISGSVQVTPPARFITVAVAHDATHSRITNAVLIAKIITNATPTIDEIVDLRPSQLCDSIFIDTETAPLIIPPVGYTQLGMVDVGDIHFNKTLCGYFSLATRAFGGDSTLVTVRATGDSTFVENTESSVYNISSGSNLIRGHVNIPSSLFPFRKIHNFYSISYKIVPTGYVTGAQNSLRNSWKLKEWNAVG